MSGKSFWFECRFAEDSKEKRQTVQQIRNNDESFQYELFKIAETKGYYKPAQPATITEIQTVKNELQ